MSASSMWIDGLDGGFPVHQAVLGALPEGARLIAAESWGKSAWAKTARLVVSFPDGTKDRYFLKCETGKTAETSMWGEYHSAKSINNVLPNFVPKPIAKGKYLDDNNNNAEVFFYVQKYHDLDLQNPVDPAALAEKLATLHRNGLSPTGMFGYPIATGGGVLHHENKWEKTWTAAFTTQFKELQALDNDANGIWPEYGAACKQMIDKVIPRLIGIMESDGREIKPVLIHFDLWEGNVATDMETGEVIAFDPVCVYAHNEAGFGTWRCSWATYFNSPMYTTCYQREIEPSEPIEEWDDRNRLYGIRAFMLDSAGHPGSTSRQHAYNDMLYLCEKYAPLDTLEKYDPQKDITITGLLEAYDVMHGAKN